MGLKFDNFNVMIFLKFLICLNLWIHFCNTTFKLKFLKVMVKHNSNTSTKWNSHKSVLEIQSV
jgi:hypothetical protein